MQRWEPERAICIVTGASSGIGRALARLLFQSGAIVYAVARREERLNELAFETTMSGEIGNGHKVAAACLSGSIHPFAGDIAEKDLRQRLIDQVTKTHGRIDLIVNAAGVGGFGPFSDASTDRLRRIFEVNFFAAVELTRESLPWLTKRPNAVVCNIGSVLGHCAVPNKSEYCASKFALHGWSNALRAELAGSGIQVTLISPSTTATEFFDSGIESTGDAKPRTFGTMTAEQVAVTTLRAIRRRKREVILSVGGNLLVWLDRLCPPLTAKILSRYR